MKRVLLVMISVLMVLGMVACGTPTTTAPETSGKETTQAPSQAPVTAEVIKEIPKTDASEIEKGLNIAYMVTLLNNGFQQVESSMGKKYAEEKYGAKVTIFDGQADNKVMAENCDEILAGGYDMVAAFVWEGETSEATIQKMIDKGTIVDTYYQKLGSLQVPFVQIVEKDQAFAMGKLAAQKWVEWYPDKPIKFAIIGYTELPVVISDRTNPFIEGVKSVVKDAELVANLDASAGTEKAYQVAQDLLQAHPEVNIIYSEANDLTMGVQAALIEAGRGKAVDGKCQTEILVSTDAPESEIKSVFDPTSSLKITMGLTPKTCGEARIDALMAAKTGKLPKDKFTAIQVSDYMIDFWNSKPEDVSKWYSTEWGVDVKF